MRWWIVLPLIVTAAGAVPDPKVTGPIPVTAAPGDPSHNYPFLSMKEVVERFDYVEEEFYIEGMAVEYALDRERTASVAPGGPYAYKTRVTVRRPKLAGKFNGTVVLEGNNVAGRGDKEIDWYWSHEHLMRRGFAYIGASVQANGINIPATGLKVWNPGRYGSLDVTAGGKFASDELSFAIFSQVAQAAKNPTGVSLLGGLKAKNVLATGHSQSAGRLAIYYNSIHPLAGVVDGFIFHATIGGGLIRTDLRTPAWRLLTETDVIRGQGPVRQPDSDYFRTWEIAGASHADWDLSSVLSKLWARDLPEAPPEVCERPTLSRVPAHLVQDAAYDWMKQWVEQGTQPPRAPRIELTKIGKMGTLDDRYSEAARDEHGNVRGGIRLAQFALPTATDTGWNSGPEFCMIYGSHVPFDNTKVERLYPSHARYVAEVNRITDENLKAGYITKEGAAETKRAAAESKIGR